MTFTEAINHLTEQAKNGKTAFVRAVNSQPGQFYSVAVIGNQLDPNEPVTYQFRLHAPKLMAGSRPVPFVPAHFTSNDMSKEFEIYEPAK
jgi:hypothetical protein